MAFDLPDVPLAAAGPIFAVLMVVVLVAPLIARRLRLPDVVVMVVLGFVVGPTGLGVIERAGAVEVLGGAGLLYLMFIAGLELDLDDFIGNRRGSIGFGILTFTFPFVVAFGVSIAFGFPLLASILLGSTFSSHTPLTYPIFQRAGTVANRAVTTSIGATIVTDTAALLVLAVVARAAGGALTLGFWLTLIPAVAVVTFVTFRGLPRLTTRFFSTAGQDPTLRFVFVLAVLYVVATTFGIVGIEPIVGAFLAGLALNRSVPNSGALMGRIQFAGSAVFVPLFLVATGMLIDLRVLADARTLAMGAAFAAVAVVGKLLASLVAARIFDFDRVQMIATFGITSPQAAATLAALVVGLDVGLIGTDTVNAIILVILTSCILASAASARTAPRLVRPVRGRDFGEVVVVPLANPTTAPRLMRLASAFARADSGLVVPVSVSPYDSPEELARMRALEADMVAVAQSAGAEARSVVRIDSSSEEGIAHTVREQDGTLLVLGWKGATATRGSRFGGVTDRVLATARIPTLLTYEGEAEYARILVFVHDGARPSATEGPLRLSLKTARHLSRELGLPIEVVARSTDDPALRDRIRHETGVEVAAHGKRRMDAVRELARPDDLLVLPTPRDDANLRIVASRLLRSTPQGAGLVIAVSDGAPPASVARSAAARDAEVSPAET